MDCRDVEHLVEEGAPLGADAERHVAGCEACRGLASAGPELPRALSGLSPAPARMDLAVLESAVRADVEGERGLGAKVRGWSRGARLLVVVGLVALDALFIAGFVRRADWAEVPAWRLALVVASHALVLLVAMWEAMRPAYRAARAPAQTIALVLAALLLPASFTLLPELPTTSPFTYGRFGWLCFTAGVAQALPILVLLGLVDRSNGQLRPLVLAAVAGGLLAQIGLTLHCPVNDRWHLITGHATVPFGLLLGVLALRRRLR